MAKRGRKPGKKYNTKKREADKNIQVVIMIILSILFAVLIYGKAGSIGKNLSPILGGIIRMDKIFYSNMYVYCISFLCIR